MSSTLWAVRVRDLRARLGMTQVEFAEKMGVSRQTIEAWERSAFKPYSPEADRFVAAEKKIEAGGRSSWFSDEEWAAIVDQHSKEGS